jgi:carboxylate-amine ligase
MSTVVRAERASAADTARLVEAGYRKAFERDTPHTVGVEEELVLVGPESCDPVGAVEWSLELLDDARFSCEFRAAQIEIATPPHASVAGVLEDLAAARAYAVSRLEGVARLLAAGAHPTGTAPPRIVPRDRYLRIADDFPWTAREGLPCGLHVHVAVSGAERALSIYNQARAFLPELAALAANSPFLHGRDTRLASARLKLNDAFPRSGIPPPFESWRSFADFVGWATTGELLPDATHLWWDLRLHPIHGTIEFRVADAQTRVEHVGALAAVCQTLVAFLAARHDAGEPLPAHDTMRIDENRSRALRHGSHGTLVELASGIPAPAEEAVARLLVSLEPFAEQLGCRNELLEAWTLLNGNGADAQRLTARLEGVSRLPHWLAAGTQPQRPVGSPLAQGEPAA